MAKKRIDKRPRKLRGLTLEDVIRWKGSQAEAARFLGMNRSAISLTKNTVPAPYFMARLATRLEVSVAKVIEDYEYRAQDVTQEWEDSFKKLQKR